MKYMSYNAFKEKLSKNDKIMIMGCRIYTVTLLDEKYCTLSFDSESEKTVRRYETHFIYECYYKQNCLKFL